tara:strand:- start:226 stop:1056 length:831 start_codon:yes stop_codon:yes gene_type:complete
MTIDKRINFRGGGMDAGAGQDFGGFSGGDNSPAAGGTTGGTTGGNTSSNTSSNNSGNDNRPTMANIAGLVTAPVTSLPSNIGFNTGFTLSTDPMDIMEQYRSGNLSTTIPGGPTFVNIDNPYMSQGLETNRYNNYLDAQNLRGSTFNPVKTPSMLVNTVANLAGGLGYEKNTQFFADNVAGNYGYGYGVEDYEQYMNDRMGGLTNAYGRTLNEGEVGYNSNDGENGISGVIPVRQITSGTETGTGTETGNDFVNNFNFGTGNNPITIYDLMNQDND